ncbi:URC4/urg3 family protein [Legionella drozanskii]|uniref:Putative biotin synthetase like protein n=1 Tax=Legionella drozanskii LLAP-1 TaxID=1212489 RepID=A0A0W0SW16_9GAMM|nr:URC4/urg3 family protein [Legionella drozanskii]KTC87505.1 putative biotin synthetase like protein [Legionella drozanskii LLAP-1]
MNKVLQSLQNLQTIRQQAKRLLRLARENKLKHFLFVEEKIPAAVDYVLKVMNDQYPTMAIPYHSRWRHFEVGGIDRIQKIGNQLTQLTAEEQGKILYELVIISVLLDAGAGKNWHYQELSTGHNYSRSEGLAIASLALYLSGAFSVQPQQPFRVDAVRLLAFSEEELRKGFQVNAENPLEGVAGRVALLNRLGTLVQKKPHYFGDDQRLGNFYSYITSLQKNHCIAAAQIFQAVLQAFTEIWPERLRYNNVPLGDVWIHPGLRTDLEGSEFVPFHKLSQWLTYSLIEPLEQFGIKVTDLNDLTGLPEYRNGGLLIDLGVLQAKDEQIYYQLQAADSEIIVEWRALTVAVLDELAEAIRQRLQMTAVDLPLAKILQGGTWEAGRRIAKHKRKDGTPPIQIISDGTVF